MNQYSFIVGGHKSGYTDGPTHCVVVRAASEKEARALATKWLSAEYPALASVWSHPTEIVHL